jgi:hypothetical protein
LLAGVFFVFLCVKNDFFSGISSSAAAAAGAVSMG